MSEWFTIEVLGGASPAHAWKDAFGDALVAAGHGEGLTDWTWHDHQWGVVLEVELPDEFAWERFRLNPAVTAALDAVPNPVGGLLVYRGRGGSSGVRSPRRPRPVAGAGGAELPVPVVDDERTLVGLVLCPG